MMKCKNCQHEIVIPQSTPCCDCRYVIEKCPEYFNYRKDLFEEKKESTFQRWFKSKSFIGINTKKWGNKIPSLWCVKDELKQAYNQALDDVLSNDCLYKFIVGGKFKLGRFKSFIENLKEP